MAEYSITKDSIITFHPLYKGDEENGFVLMGRKDIASYISLPVEALEVIDSLNSGKTVGETKEILEKKYGEEAEVEEFVEYMIENEMVKFVDGIELETTSQVQKALFTSIQANHVRWLFSKHAKRVYIAAALICLTIFILFPEYVPHPKDLFFHPLYSVAVGFMYFFGWILVAYHEVAHLFAAKVAGTEGNFSLSNRLIFVVAQTNLGNIWTVPRAKRYTVYFAGMAWDVLLVLVCLILLLIHDHQVVSLTVLGYNFVKAIVFIQVWRIIWQFRFNMQTDIYYLVANYFNCKNLLGDAKTYIKNGLSRLLGKIESVDMSAIPASEMRAVTLYAPLYFVGTAVTLATFALRDIPIAFYQILKAFDGITAGYTASSADFMDGVVLIGLNGIYFGLLSYTILRPRWRRITQRLGNHFRQG
jgi:putative peptide zinc metalloprotease protein